MAPKADHDGSDAIRPYTPISEDDGSGTFQLLIKQYKRWGNVGDNNYRPAGAVSNYLHNLPIGGLVSFKHIKFNVKLPYDENLQGFQGVSLITMIAVGVGIAPMVQALNSIFGHPGDTTKVVLLLGNRSVADILMRETLDRLSREFPERFKVVHCVGTRWAGIVSHRDDCPKTCRAPCSRWVKPLPTGFETLEFKENGWVNEQTILAHAFPSRGSEHKVFVCGLPSVYENLCGPRGAELRPGSVLHKMGFANASVVKF
jgi:NAD(P)H-flavin reductase